MSAAPVLLVLGMHRSGTSALTRALHLAGCAVTRTLLESRADNPDGYWESARLVALHELALRSIGSHGIGTWSEVTEERHAAERATTMSTLRRGFALECDADGAVVVKDPRLCHLADCAGEAIRAMGREPIAIHVVRDPDDVARSLSSRNVVAPAYASLLWRQYTLHAERLTRGWRRVLVRYERFIERPVETIAMIFEHAGLPAPDQERRAAVRAWVRPRSSTPSPSVDDAAAHELDSRIGAEPSWPDVPTLDAAWTRAQADSGIIGPGCDPMFLILQSETTIGWAQAAAVVTEWALREGVPRDEALDVDRLLRGLGLRLGEDVQSLTAGESSRAKLDQILHSTSWRMTGPLRRLVDRFRL